MPSIVSTSTGYDLREAALIRRKALLEELIGTGGGVVRYSSHFEEDGGLVLQRSCALGLEGIVSKLSASPYRSGRGRNWVKCKCSAQQEFVIAGYVPSSTGRKAVGSLVLGVYDGPALRYRRTRWDRIFRGDRQKRSLLGSRRCAFHQAHSPAVSAPPKPVRFVSFGPS